MPYIKQEDRNRLQNGGVAKTPGELNYLFYTWFLHKWKLSPKYDTIHRLHKTHAPIAAKVYSDGVDKTRLDPKDVEVAFELAWTEFYRRVVVPYEEKKIAENGDIGEVKNNETVSERPNDGQKIVQPSSLSSSDKATSQQGVQGSESGGTGSAPKDKTDVE